MATLLEDLESQVAKPGFDLKAFEKAFTDVPQNKRIPYMLDLLEIAAIKNPAAFKIMFIDILENKTSMDRKALLLPLLAPDETTKTSDQQKFKTQAEGLLIDLVATGKKDSILPLIEKQPELLTQNLTNELVRAAYESQLAGKVPKNYTKNLAESIQTIKTQAAQPKEPEQGAHTQKARPGQEVQ